MRLLGDFAPQERNMISRLPRDFAIINLEGPVFHHRPSEELKKQKAGSHIYNTYQSDLDYQFVYCLANNHIMDFGVPGLDSTFNYINSQESASLGAGYNINEAIRSLNISYSDAKFGIIARTEKQFGIAGFNKPGTAPFEPSLYIQIQKLKSTVDFVIVSLHGGSEIYPWPSPQRQITCRSLIEAGADIVHGHHAHVPQGWEEYKGGLIFYGLGNFCVDPEKWSWHPNGLWSLAPVISLRGGRIVMRPETTVIEDHGQSIAVRASTQEETLRHHEYLRICNKPLTNPVLLEGLWQEASIRMYHEYYADWLGFNSSPSKAFLRSVRKAISQIKRTVIGKTNSLDTVRSQYLLRYHLFACDSHNDAISTALGLLGGELDDLRTEETADLVNKWVIHR